MGHNARCTSSNSALLPSTWTHECLSHPPYSWTSLSNATIISLIYGKRSIPRWCCWSGSSKWLRTCNDIESRGMPFIAVVDKGTTEDAKKARTTTRITAQDKSSNRLTGRVGHKCPLLKADDWHAGDLHCFGIKKILGGWAIASKSDKRRMCLIKSQEYASRRTTGLIQALCYIHLWRPILCAEC